MKKSIFIIPRRLFIAYFLNLIITTLGDARHAGLNRDSAKREGGECVFFSLHLYGDVNGVVTSRCSNHVISFSVVFRRMFTIQRRLLESLLYSGCGQSMSFRWHV